MARDLILNVLMVVCDVESVHLHGLLPAARRRKKNWLNYSAVNVRVAVIVDMLAPWIFITRIR
jgi:hypothetical protein